MSGGVSALKPRFRNSSKPCRHRSGNTAANGSAPRMTVGYRHLRPCMGRCLEHEALAPLHLGPYLAYRLDRKTTYGMLPETPRLRGTTS